MRRRGRRLQKLAPQETDSPDSDEEPPDQGGSKVIVIHPGSRNLRIGLASETFPHTVPMVIARPSAATFSALPPTPLRVRDDPESSDPLFGQAFEDGVGKLDAILKARLKVAKKRTVPNARELVPSYNRRTQYEEVLDINDVEQIEWIDLGPDQKFCTGKDVLPTTVGGTNDRHYELQRIQSWDDIIGHYRMVCSMRSSIFLDRSYWVIFNLFLNNPSNLKWASQQRNFPITVPSS